MITIYTEVSIDPHHSGFGMYQGGGLEFGPETSFGALEDLIEIIAKSSYAVLPLEEALADPEFRALNVEDIRGLIYNQPSRIFARIVDGETIVYFGVEEVEVSDDFFN